MSQPLELNSLRDSSGDSSSSGPSASDGSQPSSLTNSQSSRFLLSSSDRYLSSDYYSLNRSIDSYEESFIALASSKFAPAESSTAAAAAAADSDALNDSDQSHLLSHSTSDSDLPHTTKPRATPNSLSETRNISAIFFLLFGISLILLFSSFILVLSVFRLPNRESIVSDYNQAVRSWSVADSPNFPIFRSEFSAGAFLYSDSFINYPPLTPDGPLSTNPEELIIPLSPDISKDMLNDQGLDLADFSPLKFNGITRILRPDIGVKGSESYEEIGDFRLFSYQNGYFTNDLNISMVLIRQESSPHISRFSCEYVYYGSYSLATSTCLHYSQLSDICLKVAWNSTLGHWEFPGGVGVHAMRVREFQHNFGCFWDGETDSWMMGKYKPIPNPFKDTGSAANGNGNGLFSAHRANRRLMQVLESISASESESEPSSGGFNGTLSESSATAFHGSLSSESSAMTDSSSYSSTADDSTSSAEFSSFDSSTSDISSSSAPDASSSSDFASSTGLSFDSSSSLTSSYIPPPPRVRPSVEVFLTVRHDADPFLRALSLTGNSLWFGLSRYSLLLLGFLIFVLGAISMIPPMIYYCCDAQENVLDRFHRVWQEFTARPFSYTMAVIRSRSQPSSAASKSPNKSYEGGGNGRSTRPRSVSKWGNIYLDVLNADTFKIQASEEMELIDRSGLRSGPGSRPREVDNGDRKMGDGDGESDGIARRMAQGLGIGSMVMRGRAHSQYTDDLQRSEAASEAHSAPALSALHSPSKVNSVPIQVELHPSHLQTPSARRSSPVSGDQDSQPLSATDSPAHFPASARPDPEVVPDSVELKMKLLDEPLD